MIDYKQMIEIMKEYRAREGLSQLSAAYKAATKEDPISTGREKRKRWPTATYDFLFSRQGGICACPKHKGTSHEQSRLLTPATRNHIDHKDPNRKGDFNHKSNLCLLLPSCNMSKGSDSIPEQSKKSGKTYRELQ